MNEIDQFRAAIEQVGLTPPEFITTDGKLHRFSSDGRRCDKAGWYIFHSGDIPAGAFGCWRGGVSETWRADIGRPLTDNEIAAHKRKIAEAERRREEEEKKNRAKSRTRAAKIWESATAAPADHAYLAKKGVRPHGLRLHCGELVVPLRDTSGALHSLQFIAADGAKNFLLGGRVTGCHFIIGEPNGALCIVEGFATAASICEFVGHAVAIGFNAGNLPPVAKDLRRKFRDLRLVVCADDDIGTPGNPGMKHARAAAQAVGGFLAVPDFGEARPERATDFNDLHQCAGPEAVRMCIDRAIPFERTGGDHDEGQQDAPNGKAERKANGEGKPKSEKRTPQADKLIALAMDAKLFHTADGTCFADMEINDHRETWPVRAKGFRRWLTRRYYEEEEGAPNSEAVQTALGMIEARAHFNSPERQVNIRVGASGGKIYIDLADEEWRAVEVGAHGWQIVEEPPVRFRRAAGMQPLPIPAPGGSVETLQRFLNIKSGHDFVLIVAWVLAALRDRGPYPILALAGEHGSAKSTFSAILRSLIDPNTAPLRALPREDRDLFIAATNGHLLCFDNISGLPTWISDTLCRLATGGGFSVRQLYTDSDEVLFDASRPVILNGIEDIVTRPDLADRAIFMTLEPIPDGRRRSEAELWAAFEKERPFILGGLLTAVSHGLRQLPRTRLGTMPRMADFALWVAACETAIWPAGTFQSAYESNLDDATESVVDADPVAAAIRLLMTKLAEWTGTATELLAEMAELAGERIAKAKTWPDSPRALSGRLRRAAPLLRKLGIEIGFDKEGHGRTRIITVTAAGVGDSSSARSAPSAKGENYNDIKDEEVRTVEMDSADGKADRPHTVRTPSAHNPLKNNGEDGADDADAKKPTPQDGDNDGWECEI